VSDIAFTTVGITKVPVTDEVTVLVALGPSNGRKSTRLSILGELDHGTSGHVWFETAKPTDIFARGLSGYAGSVFQFWMPHRVTATTFGMSGTSDDAAVTLEAGTPAEPFFNRTIQVPASLAANDTVIVPPDNAISPGTALAERAYP
jgi:hypothetical protein